LASGLVIVPVPIANGEESSAAAAAAHGTSPPQQSGDQVVPEQPGGALETVPLTPEVARAAGVVVSADAEQWGEKRQADGQLEPVTPTGSLPGSPRAEESSSLSMSPATQAFLGRERE